MMTLAIVLGLGLGAVGLVIVLGAVLDRYGKEPKNVKPIQQPVVTSMSSEDFVEYALDVIADNEAQKKRMKSHSDPYEDL